MPTMFPIGGRGEGRLEALPEQSRDPELQEEGKRLGPGRAPELLGEGRRWGQALTLNSWGGAGQAPAG